VQDEKSMNVYISPGKHGRIQRDKWVDRGEKCPVIVCVGQDPVLFMVSGNEVDYGVSEYDYAGGLKGGPIDVINGEVTGLPFPAHAEIVALRQAAREIGDHRLRDATVYSTLEPCAMCAGALVTARIARLVFGSRDLRFGAVRSKFRLADSELLNHRLEVEEGVLAGECLDLLQSFFARRRSRGDRYNG